MSRILARAIINAGAPPPMGRDSIVDRNVNIDEHREGRDQDQEAHIEAAGLHFRTLDTAAAKAQACKCCFM